MARPVRRHHHGHGPPYAGLHSGRRRNPKAGELVIHRPGQPDEIVSAGAFGRRARHSKQEDADLGQTEAGSSEGDKTPAVKAPAAQ
jgi:hypothetical protein